jgi:ribonuclease HI
MDTITAVYADGGCIVRNPSPHGGTWAWCFVDDAGTRVQSKSGLILPAEIGLSAVTNNVSEFAALARALRALPDGWSGPVFSDSQITLGRIFWGWRDKGLPAGWLWAAQANLRRLGKLEPVLLDGHPTKAQLASGIGKRGNRVSEHNVWCDHECGRVCATWQAVRVASETERVAA